MCHIGLWHQKFGKLERTGPERVREDFGSSDSGASWRGLMTLGPHLQLTVPWKNRDLVSSLEEEEHSAV